MKKPKRKPRSGRPKLDRVRLRHGYVVGRYRYPDGHTIESIV